MSHSNPSTTKRRRTALPSAGLIEPLESRIAPAATGLAVARALDLEDGTAVTISGNPASIATMKLAATGQLLGFPSGADGDFLVLSTGIASHLTSVANTGSSQGTDLGPPGADGDSAAVSFTLQVPQISAGSQRFKLDFSFLTDEYPEFVGASVNDIFTVTINGVNYAVDGHGNPMGVNNDYFQGLAAPGTYFDGRTDKLTLTYAVPAGVTSLNVELRISDVGDGQVDSAVLVDNVRFETAEKIYLNFDGGLLDNHFGPGISANIPAFQPSDLGSNADIADLENQILAGLQQKFAAYDITFTTTKPAYGNYATVFIGGTNNLALDLSNASALLQSQFGSTGSVHDVLGLGSDALLGLSGPPDIGNLDHNDKAVIFSGEFAGFFGNDSPETRVDDLIVTIAHEIGHNLGLRHTTDANPGDIMSATAPRSSTATFGNSLVALGEQWSDGVTEQNDSAYLMSVLGGAGTSATGLQVSSAHVDTSSNFLPKLSQTLYNVTIHIVSGDSDGAGLTMHFNKLDGSQNISLPLLPAGALISISGASQLGGQIDTYTGTPHSGMLNDADTLVPLFDGSGHLATLALAKLQSGGTFGNGGTVGLDENTLGNVNVAPGKTITLTDEDGDLYTIRLTGPGKIGYLLDDIDLNGKGPLQKLVLDGTTFGESALTITVQKRGPNGDGHVDIGEIVGTAGAGLKLLSAPAMNFIGDGINFSGALGTVTIGDLPDAASLIGGAAAGGKSVLRLHAVGDGTQISLGTDVTLFQAARIGDSSISFPSLTKLLVTGDKTAGITPDFGAQMHISGHLGSFSVGDVHPTASLDAGGSPLDRTVLAMRSVADGVSISLASTVTSLRATSVGDATFNAQAFDSIILTGALAGDISANGKIGRLTGRDLTGTASITAGGLATDKTVLLLGSIQDGAAITLDSSISMLRATKVGDADITAASVGILSVTGNVTAGIAGNFSGTLILAGGDSFFKNSLTLATIAGTVDHGSINAESIGTFSAGSISNSTIYAGFSPADPLHPYAGGVFFDGGIIKSLIVRSAHPGLENSVIAATNVATIRLLGLDLDNAGTAFGILTHTIPTKVSIKNFNYYRGGLVDQYTGDFHIKIQ